LDIFSTSAPTYWEAGLPVIPTAGKRPVLKQWQHFAERMPTPDEQEAWLRAYPGHNLGLPLGTQSGLCAVDIDTDEPEIVAAIMNVLPGTPYARVGRKGCALLFRFSGQRNFKLKGDDGNICEFLGAGNQVILPPSVHPDTARPYTSSVDLCAVLSDLPSLPLDIEARLRQALTAYGVAGPTTRGRAPTAGGGAQFGRFSTWIEPRLEDALAELSAATEGHRNTTLFKTAVRIANDVAAAGGDWEAVADRFMQVAIAIGEEEHKSAGTLQSAWKSGSDKPTPWIRLSTAWVYLAGPDSFYHVESKVKLSQKGFNAEFGSSNPAKKMSLAEFLLRNDYVPKVQDTTYDPRQSQGLIERDGRGWFNTFAPSSVVAVEGDASHFETFMRHVAPDDAERAHLSKALAFLIRNPDQKLSHALMIGSEEHGIGKSTLLDILWELLGPANCRKASSKQLEEKFNSYIAGTRLVLVEELAFGSSGLAGYNHLKDMITSRFSPVRRMYQDACDVENFATFVFLTNRRIPLMIEPDDRRIWFIRITSPKPSPAYWREFHAWWKNNLGVIRHWFDQVDISEFDPHEAPPMTEAKRDLIQDSRSPLAYELQALIDSRDSPFDVDVTTYDAISEAMRHRGSKAGRKELEQD
jgi:hypothetical protein